MLELSKESVISVAANAQTAAQTAVTTSVVDMSGFDAVSFVAKLNTVVDGSLLTLTAYENSVNSNSGGTAITNGATATTTAAGSSNTTLVVDVIRPKQRYVYATLTRTAQNATVDSVLALQYRAKNIPVTQPATVIASAMSSPEA